MRDPQSSDQRSYTNTPQYSPIRRSGRQHYLSTGTTVGMQHPPQYHTSNAALPSNYSLDLGSYSHQPPHAISSSNSPQPSQTNPGSSYLDSFPGMPMADVMELGMDPSPMGIDLSILSTEEHRDLRMMENRPRGLARQEPSQEGSSGERRRRQRRAHSDDSIDTPPDRSTAKKQRGRPRLDPTDENAADRRRTQIRLAQRAYRLRKETTISSLRSRVTELENAIENMQTTFLELHEFAMKCAQKNEEREISSETIRNLTERFMAQSKGALGSDNAESLGEGEDTHDDGSHGDRNERPRSRDDGGPTSGGTSGMSGGLPPWGGYQVSYTRGPSHEDTTYNNGTSGSTSRSTYESTPQDQNSFNSYMDQPVLSFYPSPPPISPELEGPGSYSLNETSFSRRLHRKALENAYRLLTSPTADQNDVARTFAYTFCYATRQDIINNLTRLLRAGTNESLSPRDYPELQFFPPRPLNNYDDILQAYQDKARTDVLEASNSSLRAEAYKQLLKLGINNKFLGPDDVENVLAENGILERIEAPTSCSDHMSSPESSQDLGYLSPPPANNGCANSQTSTDSIFLAL
ncbi:hypothetical protein BDD12DRAFT_801314 [Trichophaea hybrida]|nr:hypothetical protein BDD12DRAFT_801314 [Trichophaea hybrida]